jgi:hypothetical protein
VLDTQYKLNQFLHYGLERGERAGGGGYYLYRDGGGSGWINCDLMTISAPVIL